MEKKISPKVACKRCLFFNDERRCDVKSMVKALSPGKKRRCASFKERYVKIEDLKEKMPRAKTIVSNSTSPTISSTTTSVRAKKETFLQQLNTFFKRRKGEFLRKRIP